MRRPLLGDAPPLDDLRGAARLLSRMAATVQALCAEQGTTLTQYRILVYLSRTSMRPGELADLLRVTRPAASTFIRGLQAKGLLERATGIPSDGRGARIIASESGRALVDRIDEQLMRYVDELMREVDPAVAIADIVDILHPTVRREADQVTARLRSLRQGGDHGALSQT
jgi:DNA-binding MarR family transcriptional regulator